MSAEPNPSPRVATASARAGFGLAAWLLGTWSTVAYLRGDAGVVVYGPVQHAALRALLPVTLLGIGAALLLKGRVPAAQLLAQLATTAGCVGLAASNVGRAPALVAATATFAAYAALVEWTPWKAGRDRSHPVALLAVPTLLLGLISWARGGWPIPTLALYAATFAVVEAYRRAPGPMEGADETLRRSAVAGARATGRAVVAAVGRTRALVRDHREGVLVAGVGVGLGLGMLPLYWRMCNDYPRALYMGINDYDLHMQTAARIRLYPLRVDAPHFIFHVLAKGSSLVLGHRLGPVVVLSVATAVAYVATYVLFRLPARRLPRMSTGAAIGGSIAFFVLETPVAILLYAHLVSARTRFLTQQTLYSPTWVAALPFSLVTLILLARIIGAGPEPDPDGDARRQRRLVRWLAAVVLVGTIAKPAFALCLVPGLAAYLLITARWPVRRIVGLWAWVAVPAAAVIAWQTWYLTTGVSKLWDDHFVFHPIGGPVFGWRQVGPLYFLPLLWIVLAIWATRGRFLADRLVQLVLWCTCFAVPIFLLFREEGGRGQDGNLGVPSQVCVALLTLLALRALTAETAAWARRRTTEGVRPPLWMACAGLLALPFLAAFGLAYADTMGWLRIHIEWYPFY